MTGTAASLGQPKQHPSQTSIRNVQRHQLLTFVLCRIDGHLQFVELVIGITLASALTGSASCDVRWKRPIYGTIYQLLTNPGLRGRVRIRQIRERTRYEAGVERANARRRPREQWLAFIPGTHERYVEWERFERVQRAIRGNLPAPLDR